MAKVSWEGCGGGCTREPEQIVIDGKVSIKDLERFIRSRGRILTNPSNGEADGFMFISDIAVMVDRGIE